MSTEPPHPEHGATSTRRRPRGRACHTQRPSALGFWRLGPRGEGKERATPVALTQPGAGARFLLETLSCHRRLQREGRLSHRCQGWGCPRSARCSHTQAPLLLVLLPTAHPAAQWPPWPQTRKEGGGGWSWSSLRRDRRRRKGWSANRRRAAGVWEGGGQERRVPELGPSHQMRQCRLVSADRAPAKRLHLLVGDAVIRRQELEATPLPHDLTEPPRWAPKTWPSWIQPGPGQNWAPAWHLGPDLHSHGKLCPVLATAQAPLPAP